MDVYQKILCLDVGDKRIGIAVSDAMGWTAQPVETYTRKGYGPDVRHIEETMRRTGAQRLLLGLPRNMDGSEGEQAQKVRALAEQLENAGMRVVYYDERLTTRSAHASLIESGMRRSDRKNVVDQVAAQLILQSFLDAGGLQAGASLKETE